MQPILLIKCIVDELVFNLKSVLGRLVQLTDFQIGVEFKE